MASSQGDEGDSAMQLKKLKYLRRGKKSAITKRINELEELVNKSGKKRMIKFLSEGLQAVFQELSEVCTDIAVLENYDSDEYNDIEEVRNRVDKCVALVVDLIGDRSERSSSTGSMTSS